MTRHTIWILTTLTMLGCAGPVAIFPGGQLQGEETPLTAPLEAGVLQLETRPTNPYSVNLGFVLIDAQMYIDPTPERTWYTHLQNNPEARVRIGDRADIHPIRVEEVTEPQILERFEDDRIVLRLLPR